MFFIQRLRYFIIHEHVFVCEYLIYKYNAILHPLIEEKVALGKQSSHQVLRLPDHSNAELANSNTMSDCLCGIEGTSNFSTSYLPASYVPKSSLAALVAKIDFVSCLVGRLSCVGLRKSFSLELPIESRLESLPRLL